MMQTRFAIAVAMVFLLGAGGLGSETARGVSRPRPRVAAGAWRYMLAAHPRILGSALYLRSRAKESPDLYSRAATSATLAGSAIARLVGGDRAQEDQYIRRTMDSVALGATNSHQDTWVALRDAAFTFDFFHDDIPAVDRQKIIQWMNAHLETYTTDENAFHNSTLAKILTYLQIAYATWGENPKAKEFRDYALSRLYEGKVVLVLNEFGAGGGFTEAGWYSRGSLWALVEGLELARRIDGYDGFQKAPRFFYQRLAYEMFQPYPTGSGPYGSEVYPVEGDGYDATGDYPRQIRMILAQYFRGSDLARATAARNRPVAYPAAAVEDLAFRDVPEAPSTLNNFPLAHLASGIGNVYARSDWGDDATWFRFNCGDYWTRHQHLDVGNFEIFRREPLATESGEFYDWASSYSMNWLVRSIAHNTILVYEPDEHWAPLRDGGLNAPYANDGGQAGIGATVADTFDEWSRHRDQYHRGSIVAYQDRREYMYVAGDCSAAYSPSKLSLYMRQIVFLRPHTFVIFDRVISTKPEFKKTWLLHCANEPEIRERTATISSGKGRLVVQTLLPANAIVTKVGGYTYGGRTFVPTKPAIAPVTHSWRIEVTPSVEATEDVFLNVLSTDEVEPATLIREDSLVGVRVGSRKVLFNRSVGGHVTLDGKTFQLMAAVVKGKYE